MLLACCWVLFQFHLRLEDRLDPALAGQKIKVHGVVASIPVFTSDYARFRFETDTDSYLDGMPATLLVHWYRDWPKLQVGQRWQLLLKLKPPWGRVNFQGSDKERWLFAQGIGGLGTVYEGLQLAAGNNAALNVDGLRAVVLEKISGQVKGSRERGIVQALATADRSGIAAEDSRLLNATGTSHLLAISGLHVGLAAAGGMWAGRLFLLVLPARVFCGFSFPVMVAAGLLSAALYAALAGFGTPTVRSVLMLLTAMLAVLFARSIHPFRAWLTSLTIIVLADPFAPANAGFWFSFIAVAALLAVFLPRTGALKHIQTALIAQAAVILVLLPVSVALFYSFSPAAFIANIFAIPWVSLVVVPPVLGGLVVALFSESAAGVLWTFAGEASSLLFRFLEGVDAIQGNLPTLAPPSRPQVLLALLGAMLLLLPRGLPYRWMGAFLLVPLFILPGDRTRPGELEMEILDVGQGTAVVLNSGHRTLLYDSGPGRGEGNDLVASVITPALAARGVNTLSHVVISHGDMDHAGGLESLIQRYGHASYRGNLAEPHPLISPCVWPAKWAWPEVSFEVLHPTPGLPYLGNDSSCVISVKAGDQQILLSGDVSSLVEDRLLLGGIQRHKVLLVPHHGSKSSSGEAFVHQLAPEVAIATASLGNRFGFPRPEIRQRYSSRGTQFLSTGDCGAIRLTLQADGKLRASSARREKNRVWRWPAAGNCP